MTTNTRLPEYPFYDQPGPIAIAHRGGDAAGAEKENSLAAFQSAVDAGLQYGETDVVATRDGVPLAFHGSRNTRQEQITGLPLRAELQTMTHDEVTRHVRIGGEVVPTLEEVLVSFPDMKFFIDPKTDESVEPLAQLIKQLSAQDRVSIGAFSWKRTKGVLDLLEGRQRVCSSMAIVGSLALLGARAKLPLPRTYLERSGATQFAVPHNWIDQYSTGRAHEAGMRVVAWTPNTEQTINQAFVNGADGVMSDQTTMVRDIAAAHQNRVQ